MVNFVEYVELLNLLPFMVAILTLLGVGIKVGMWIKGISDKVTKVEDRLKTVESNIGLLLFLHKEDLFKLYDRYFPPHGSNPSETEKERLLAKLRDGTITPQEAERLKPLLEKQRSEALVSGLVGAAIVIGGLLLLLAIISAFGRER
jgi:hypothetical protein